MNTDTFQQGASSVRNTCVLCPWIERGKLWWNMHSHVNLAFHTLLVCQKLCPVISFILFSAGECVDGASGEVVMF